MTENGIQDRIARFVQEEGGLVLADADRIAAGVMTLLRTRRLNTGREDYQERFIDLADEPIPTDEPVFLLRGQDRAGAAAVRGWAIINLVLDGDALLSYTAEEHACSMEDWPIKKVSTLYRQAPEHKLGTRYLTDELIEERLGKVTTRLATLKTASPGGSVYQIERYLRPTERRALFHELASAFNLEVETSAEDTAKDAAEAATGSEWDEMSF